MQSSGGNNQLRQLQTEIERLKTDLRNFKIAINDIKITNKNVVQDVSGINRLIQNIRTRISSHGYSILTPKAQLSLQGTFSQSFTMLHSELCAWGVIVSIRSCTVQLIYCQHFRTVGWHHEASFKGLRVK